MSDKSVRIAALNDAVRKNPIAGKNHRLLVTPGISALTRGDALKLTTLMLNVAEFGTFNEDNDPHGEHDFGAFLFDGEKIFWKIDYYALDMEHGSEDPSDPEKTVRVLTVMLASEY